MEYMSLPTEAWHPLGRSSRLHARRQDSEPTERAAASPPEVQTHARMARWACVSLAFSEKKREIFVNSQKNYSYMMYTRKG